MNVRVCAVSEKAKSDPARILKPEGSQAIGSASDRSSSLLESSGSVTAQERRRLTAKAIAWDEAGDEANGYATWESNHSCGSYGCCGGGKDIDRVVLVKLIEDALALASSPASVAPVAAADALPPDPLPQRTDETTKGDTRMDKQADSIGVATAPTDVSVCPYCSSVGGTVPLESIVWKNCQKHQGRQPYPRPSMRHVLKVWPRYFRGLVDGAKTFELRKDDRDYRVGDTLELMEWVPVEERYTGCYVNLRVSYIVRGEHAKAFGLQPGFCVMSLEEPEAVPAVATPVDEGKADPSRIQNGSEGPARETSGEQRFPLSPDMEPLRPVVNELLNRMAADVLLGSEAVDGASPPAQPPPAIEAVIAEMPTSLADAAEMLWVVLANVSGGDWTKQTPEWREAAARWRDNYFAALRPPADPPREEPSATTFPLTRQQAEYVVRVATERDMPDHACRRCVPDAMSDTFVCLRHLLTDWLATHGRGEEPKA